MDTLAHEFGKKEIRRFFVVVAVLVVLILGLIGVAILQARDAVETVHRYGRARSVAAAIERHSSSLLESTRASDDWDDEVVEDAVPVPNPRQSGVRLMHLTPREQFGELWLLDSKMRVLVKFDADQDRVGSDLHIQPAIVRSLLTRAERREGPAAGILGDKGQVASFAAVPMPDDSELLDFAPATKGGYIVAKQQFGKSNLARLASDISISDAYLARGAVPRGTPHVAIKDIHGQEVAKLAWSAGNPVALGNLISLPVTLGFGIAIVLVNIWLLRVTAASLRVLNRQAHQDSLSRMPNRTALRLRLRKAEKEGAPSALAMIDLDSFKEINDHHGHQTGDAVIRRVAALLRDCLPDNAYAARMGGDEFAIHFTNAIDRALVLNCLQNLIDAMLTPCVVNGHTLRLGCSIGVVFFSGSLRATEALRRADIAMYNAKSRGKAQISTFHPRMDKARQADIELKEHLALAIGHDEISVAYQPIICARTGRVAAIEALARWTSRDLGVIAPDDFIRVAEQFGLIGVLGERVIDCMIADLHQLPPIRVALNVSAAQIGLDDFGTKLLDGLKQANIPPDRIEIEITETSLLRNPETLHQSIRRLGGHGIRHILDDFGAGYASIGFLRQFPFGAVKIDRTIIQECNGNERARATLLAIVALAHAQDMEVIAEGIETVVQAEIARAAGCNYLQGWLYSRAVDLKGITEFLAAEGAIAARAA
jgi:diguanylate cyclase (GGDEF)-like protein